MIVIFSYKKLGKTAGRGLRPFRALLGACSSPFKFMFGGVCLEFIFSCDFSPSKTTSLLVRIIIFLYYGGRRPFRAFFWCFFEPFQVPFRASPGACSSLAKRPDGGLRPVRACLGAFSSPFQVRFSSFPGRLFEPGCACLECLCVGSLIRYRTKMLV